MTASLAGAETLERRLAETTTSIVPYLTGGFPTLQVFSEALRSIAKVSVAVEIGIPFSDPMADGATIQESSRVALDGGTTLDSIIGALEEIPQGEAELVVMSYLNPLLAYGLDGLMPRLRAAGVTALVIPDLPYEESSDLAEEARDSGIGLVQLVSPVTSVERLAMLGAASEGFTYAVTMTGTTGGTAGIGPDVTGYLDRVRAASRPPVLAGFGVRSREQVRALAPHCDGVIVGSALVEVLASGEDPVAYLQGLIE